ncbi:MAG: energy-coupling factor transporter ATP-binding protein EcfA2 [Natronomonas sp.]|jgi:energy-coupling factor transporter ATP-binding protein EcfA2
MDLSALRVQNYRIIDDSGWVSVDDFLALIGRNESGKTAFMKAVQGLNPPSSADEYVPYEDYPREKWAAYSDTHEEEPAVVASARFSLDPGDIQAVEDAYGDILAGDSVTASRDYKNDLRWGLDLEDGACLEYLRSERDLPETLSAQLATADALSELPGYGADEDDGLYAELAGHLGEDPEAVLANDIGAEVLADRLPVFRYLGEYSIMDGTIRVAELIERREADELTPGDRVFLSLLTVAGLDVEDLQDVEDWRRRTTELETASAAVSEEVMGYWGQSGDIRIRIQAREDADDRLIDVRVENRAHDVTVGFEQRSQGFRRFFSTFCQLSELQRQSEEVVLLLDEPGLNLHARAKQDFLEFLKTELAAEFPLVYATHSPFMIDREQLGRTKMVQAEPLGDGNVFTDVSLADAYTQFPLRNAFELDLMDTLLVRPQTLLVEGKADHIYLYVLSKMLRDVGKTALDDRWTVIPITDGENIGSFVSLFDGDLLDVAALLSEEPSSYPEGVRLSTVAEYANSGESTVEDILSEPFYLELVNRTYATEIEDTDDVPNRVSPAEVGGDGRVVGRLRSYFRTHGVNGGEFDRKRPALYLQENRAELAEELDSESRRGFTRLFTDLNNILVSFDGVERRDQSLLSVLGL